MKKILFFILTLVILLPTFAFADGGIMPRPGYWMLETGQKAAIVFQNNTETLVLSTSFQGDAKDFAYIVPTPSQPEVTKVSDDIFQNLLELTMPQGKGGIVPLFSTSKLGAVPEDKSVTVVEEKKVGFYDVKVLTATDASALYEWLKENDFIFPANKKYILDDYIQNKWFFTTAKISIEAISEDVQSKLHSGELMPLKLVFQTQNIVYPLKISSVAEIKQPTGVIVSPIDYFSETSPSNSGSDKVAEKEIAPGPIYGLVPITLYIFSDHKKEIPNFSIQYANWIKSKDIKKLAKDDAGNPWVSISGSKMYLTKLTRTMNYSDMTNDLFPDNAKDNNKVGVPNWWETNVFAYTLVIVLFVLLTSFYIAVYWQFKPVNRKYRMVCWILQITSFVIFGLPILLMLLYYLIVYLTSYLPVDVYILIPAMLMASIPASMLVIMLAERRIQKNLQ